MNQRHLAAITLVGLLSGATALGHCEIPCGIYGDRLRIDLLREHCETIEKSMQQIKEQRAAPTENANQLVRWIVNKEEHANKIQEIVYQYFMNQRVTPVADSEAAGHDHYVTQITLLHRMLVTSMKCKQTLDEAHVAQLRALLDAFEDAYFTAAEQSHGH
ncbi:MAG: superoxide dismutase [Candidatus Marinimicrobia bacterium]|nr:superoxide dismutase [Candidatus Neomarinimicrobiota bacterium]